MLNKLIGWSQRAAYEYIHKGQLVLRGWDNFIYNAATSTTHAVTTHAIIFKTMLSYKRLHIITTPTTCTKQSPTRQLGPTLSLTRG